MVWMGQPGARAPEGPAVRAGLMLGLGEAGSRRGTLAAGRWAPAVAAPGHQLRPCLLRAAPLQVFSTYSNEDYDRRNEDVDPMAASAEYELEKRVERLELFPVELEKGERPGPGCGGWGGISSLAPAVPQAPVGTPSHAFSSSQSPCPHRGPPVLCASSGARSPGPLRAGSWAPCGPRSEGAVTAHWVLPSCSGWWAGTGRAAMTARGRRSVGSPRKSCLR